MVRKLESRLNRIANPATLQSMAEREIWRAIGLMTGTSMDGVDAAYVETDGEGMVRPGPSVALPYPTELVAELRRYLGKRTAPDNLVQRLTDRNAEAVLNLMRDNGLAAEDIDVVGYHGQTILHEPHLRRTTQLGDGRRLAEAVGIDVVNDLRSADMAQGGQGAPLVPVFHKALVSEMALPVAVVNIGGVANVTWIGAASDDLLGFDTGPGNALIDEWARQTCGTPMDKGGALAASGQVDPQRLAALLDHPYFAAPPPKSLDRLAFDAHVEPIVADLSAADGAAALTALTAATIVASERFFPKQVQRWILAGGGCHNPQLVREITARANASVELSRNLGWNSDVLEAQAFAYLAVRSRLGLPLTFPGTTGCKTPTSGGVLHRK